MKFVSGSKMIQGYHCSLPSWKRYWRARKSKQIMNNTPGFQYISSFHSSIHLLFLSFLHFFLLTDSQTVSQLLMHWLRQIPYYLFFFPFISEETLASLLWKFPRRYLFNNIRKVLLRYAITSQDDCQNFKTIGGRVVCHDSRLFLGSTERVYVICMQYPGPYNSSLVGERINSCYSS